MTFAVEKRVFDEAWGAMRILAMIPLIGLFVASPGFPQNTSPAHPPFVTSSYRTSGVTFSLSTKDARATLLGLLNPELSHDSAMQIASMHGNQGVIRKLQEFRIPSTTEIFAAALYASAHGQNAATLAESALGFERLKPKAHEVSALLDEIDADPMGFQKAIETRIRMFTPAQSNIHLDGYVVSAGDGAGYAFGGTDFFLNIGLADDIIVAKSTATHELYHAVQGAYAKQRVADLRRTQGDDRQHCVEVERLFESLYEEGSARYVEDPSLLAQSKSEAALHIVADVNEGIVHVQTGVTLLEMSVTALDGATALSYDDVYEVGFLGHGVLYGIGYVMAKDIVESDGKQGLAIFLKRPVSEFVMRYVRLKQYGADTNHPRLGVNTVAAAERLAAGCK